MEFCVINNQVVRLCAVTAGDAKVGLLFGRMGRCLLLHLKPCGSHTPTPISHYSSSNGTGVTGQYNLASNEISPLTADAELSFWTEHRIDAHPGCNDK